MNTDDLTQQILDALVESWETDETATPAESLEQSLAVIRGVVEPSYSALEAELEDIKDNNWPYEWQIATKEREARKNAERRLEAEVAGVALVRQQSALAIADLEQRLEMAREALERINDCIEPIDNGRCGICRIGFRSYGLKGKPQPCSRPDCLSHKIDNALTQLAAPLAPVERRPHSIMTRDEYDKFTLQGWHEVCHNYESGNTAVRYLGVVEDAQLAPVEGTWGWALEQMKAGKKVTCEDHRLRYVEITLALGIFDSGFVEYHQYADRWMRGSKAFVFEPNDFIRTDWRIADES